MAGIATPIDASLEGKSPFGHLSRLQYRALMTMRWRLLVNSIRSAQGAFELGARGVAFLLYSIMGLSIGVGLGIGSYSMAAHNKWQLMPALFWVVFVAWQVLPVALASFQEQFDLSSLLRFPVNFGSFYLLHLVFGLVDIPALLGGLCCFGIGLGFVIAKPNLMAWTLLVLVVFAIFNILLARAVLAWIDRWLAQRRTREIVSALFLLLMLSMQLLNPALRPHRRHGPRGSNPNAYRQRPAPEITPWMKDVNMVLTWLPPGLVASSLNESSDHDPAAAAGSLSILGLYVLAVGGVLAHRLRAEFRGENLGEAPVQKKAEYRKHTWLIDGSGPIAAVMEKELRTVPRSMPLLFAMGGPLLTVLVIGSLLRNGAFVSGRSFLLGFPLCVSYALLGFTQMIYNNLGAEGTAIQLLFLSPTPFRTVLLAKNLFHAIMYSLVAILAGIFAGLRMGFPRGAVIVATAAWLLFALPANLAAGNILSINMPYRVSLGRLSRQRGSQASALLSMFIQMAAVAVGAGVFELSAYLGRLWLATPIFLLLAGIMTFVWMRVLSNADGMATRNKDALLLALAKTD
jgi:ABC-2 type transport system permease protein